MYRMVSVQVDLNPVLVEKEKEIERKRKRGYWKLWPAVRLHEWKHINLRCTRHS